MFARAWGGGAFVECRAGQDGPKYTVPLDWTGLGWAASQPRGGVVVLHLNRSTENVHPFLSVNVVRLSVEIMAKDSKDLWETTVDTTILGVTSNGEMVYGTVSMFPGAANLIVNGSLSNVDCI